MSTRRQRPDFRAAKRIEQRYSTLLRKVADHVRQMVLHLHSGEPETEVKLRHALEKFAEAIEPYARSVAYKMIAEASRQDLNDWQRYTKEMSVALRQEILKAPTGEFQRQLLNQQVTLIKSLPLEAAKKAHEYTLEAQAEGFRPNELLKKLMTLGDITENRARLIARTESGRMSSTLTQARSQYIGCTQYVWRTARDGTVRPSHKKMEGQVVKWSDPPTLDNLTGHAGALPNCRCFPEPILPDRFA